MGVERAKKQKAKGLHNIFEYKLVQRWHREEMLWDYSQLYNVRKKTRRFSFWSLIPHCKGLYISLLVQQLRGYISKQQIKIG